MFRALVWTLRQRRYAGLALAGLIVALGCAAAGTFEIHRYQEKRHDNAVLRANAHAPATALTTALVPLTGAGAAPSASAILYRHVTARGTYLRGGETYVDDQTQGGRQGFYVLTPLRTSSGMLLVVRGFVAATSQETRPAVVAPPPSRQVEVSGWLRTPDTAGDRYGRLGHGEITSVNPAQQAGRLGAPVYQAYLTLAAHQPGTAGLTRIPAPGLGNPSGGAAEWQLLSYVVQWYAFAVLALILPFATSRAEVRDARQRFLGIDPGAAQLDDQPAPRAIAAAAGGELAPRARGELAARVDVERRVQRAERLADRYGRSLGVDPVEAVPDPAPVAGRPVVRDSSMQPHRSEDAYHAGYNDYLWQLALADGGMPDVFADGEPERPVRRIVEATDDDDPPSDAEPPVP